MPQLGAKLPTATKRAKGNPGGRKIRDDEPQPAGGIPDCPDWLGLIGQEHWNYILKTFPPGLMTQVDRDMLAQYCYAWEQFHVAREDVERCGIRQGARRNPALMVMSDAQKVMIRLATMFGLSPRDRVGLSVPSEEKDEISEMFRVRAG